MIRLSTIQLALLIIIAMLISMQDSIANHSNPFKDRLDSLVARREQVKKRAHTCVEGDYTAMYSHSQGRCHQGDLTIFSGINCLAATLAGDTETLVRCRDVSDSHQDFGSRIGRWWRGPTHVDGPEGKSFSRDQGLGVLSYLVAMKLGLELNRIELTNQQKKDWQLKANQELRQWITYIDRIGGKQMCVIAPGKSPIGHGCNIFQGQGFATVMYRTFKAFLGEDFESLPSKTLLPRLRKTHKSFSFFKAMVEAKTTRTGYHTHLKTLELMIHFLLNRLSNNVNSFLDLDKFHRLMDIVIKRDAYNPWNHLLKNGLSNAYIDEVLAHFCPAKLRQNSSLVSRPSLNKSYSFQRHSPDRRWEVGNGHDCVFLLNMMIAEIRYAHEGGNFLPNREKALKCPDGQIQISDYEGFLVCQKEGSKKIQDESRCLLENGIMVNTQEVQWKRKTQYIRNASGEVGLGGTHLCLVKKRNHFQAFPILSICKERPFARGLVGLWDVEMTQEISIDLFFDGHLEANREVRHRPICETRVQRIDLASCMAREGNMLRESRTICLYSEGAFFSRRRISKNCPPGAKHIGHSGRFDRPLCIPEFTNPVQKSWCQKKLKRRPGYNFVQDGHCVVENDGFFNAYPIIN